MAVEIKNGAATATQTEVVNNQEAEVVKLELRSLSRLHYGDTLYVKEGVYIFDEAGARHMLSLKDPNGGRSFRISTRKPGAPLPVSGSKVEKADKEELPQGPIPTPVGAAMPAKFIDLSDNDDPELAAKLAAADADDGLIDTANGVKLT